MFRVGLLAVMSFVFCGVLFAQSKAEVGKPAPQFTLTDIEGKQHSLSDLKGRIVVLEWTNPKCPFVVRHYKEQTMTKTAAQFADKGVLWLAINSGHQATADEMKKWASRHDIAYPILLDNSGEVGRAYGAKTTPHMFIIDREGQLVYAGGIDNDPDGEKSDRTNYVAAALKEVTDGKQVSQAQTKPYGCSVKYAK